VIKYADKRSEELAGPFMAWLASRDPAPIDVLVTVTPDEYLCIREGGSARKRIGFGAYAPQSRKGKQIVVISPAACAEVLRDNGYSNKEDAELFFLENLAHECKHYLQDVSGLIRNEREANMWASCRVQEYTGPSK
jgi:hypothetical protein